jgi:N-acetylglutamate synthase-like GNAT family acetyltransferase
VHNEGIDGGRQIMGEELSLRAATNDDLPAMVALLAAEGLPEDGVATGLAHFHVLDDGNGVVAAAGIEPHGSSALLRSVVVAPAHRGRGLARRLTERMVQHARGLGHDSLYLLTMDADRYFSGLGFTRVARDQAPDEIRRCQQFREQCPDSAVLMHMAIQSRPAPR